jgi:hypothetical protein
MAKKSTTKPVLTEAKSAAAESTGLELLKEGSSTPGADVIAPPPPVEKPKKEKPIAKIVKAKAAKAGITGLVLLTSKVVDSDNTNRVGLSFRSQDEQEVFMEIAVCKKAADELTVDKTYEARFFKGIEKGATFSVHHLNEVDFGTRYEEKMVVKGDIKKTGMEGHVYMRILPKQEKMFFEKKDYTLQLIEVESED